jgi:hypothetical protein
MHRNFHSHEKKPLTHSFPPAFAKAYPKVDTVYAQLWRTMMTPLGAFHRAVSNQSQFKPLHQLPHRRKGIPVKILH